MTRHWGGRGWGQALAVFLLSVSCILKPEPGYAQRIKDLANIAGVRSNQLVGYGVVVGLDNTGDTLNLTGLTLSNVMSVLGLVPTQGFQTKSAASVMVTATLPPFAKPGQTIDVTVSALGGAKSLRGGTLVLTPLKGGDGQIYAMAQGNLLVGGAGGSAGGSSVQVNHLSAGRIPAGATVERVVQTQVGQGDFIELELKETDFTTASRVSDAIELNFGKGVAIALDARRIQVKAPADPGQRVAFLSRLENLTLTPASPTPKVIINPRTGSVVMNQLVTLDSCAIAHGSLSVVVTSEQRVSQPAPFGAGQTVVTEQADVQVKKESGELVVLPASATLNDVVKALNAVGATPQDLLAILQAMKASGALKADLEVI
ncbi:MAG: flgI [bacterium]|nr:MAG: flgI [bacterium]KAF0147569.1 MAG: flgI [bacterium]KAF0169400.1 MAG: flgI [bacterium]TXT17962.1 MAG: flgI [bacterium]